MALTKYERYSMATSPIKCFLLGLLCLLMATGFTVSSYLSKPASYNEAVKFSETFGESVECVSTQSRRTYLTIYFKLKSGITYSIHHSCTSGNNIKEKLDSLKKGSKITFVADEKTGYILEVKSENKELLNYDYACNRLQTENKLFFGLGVFIGLCGLYLIAHAISLVYPRKKKRKKRRHR